MADLVAKDDEGAHRVSPGPEQGGIYHHVIQAILPNQNHLNRLHDLHTRGLVQSRSPDEIQARW